MGILDWMDKFLGRKRPKPPRPRPPGPTPPEPTPPGPTPPEPTPPEPSSSNPFAGETIYGAGVGPAVGVRGCERISSSGATKWIGEWVGNYETATRNWVDAAGAQGKLPVIATYLIPQRDCGGYSSGGLDAAGFRAAMEAVSRGIGSRKCVVVLEPDAVPQWDCLNSTDLTRRVELLLYAVEALKRNPATYVYIDAGHPSWHPASAIAARLNRVIGKADGFSLNVSNFVSTAANIAYGREISARVGGKHYVVDTSRNGNGPYTGGTHSGGCPAWADPPGRALGRRPGTPTADPLCDAYLFVKYPGESDGCVAAAGTFLPDYARSLCAS